MEPRDQALVLAVLTVGAADAGNVQRALALAQHAEAAANEVSDQGWESLSLAGLAQAAADAAALAAAEELNAGATGNEQTVANTMAKLNGFDNSLSTNPASVYVSAPTSGNYAGSSSYVQVVVTKPIPTFFMSVFNNSLTTMTVSGRAVAGGGQVSPTCICLESPSGMDLNLSNNAQLSASTCGVTVDSSSSNAVGISGSAELNALSLGTVSNTWDNSNNINNNGTISSTTHVVQGITTQCKPSVTPPTLPTGITCNNNPIAGWTAANNYTGAYTLPTAADTPVSGVVCYNSLDTSQSSQVTFIPGYTYYIKGNFSTGGGAPLSGNGVTFYVGGTGLVYAPNAAVTLNNGTGTTLNMDFVAQTLTMAGGATLTSYSTANLGTLNNSVAKITE